MEGDRKRERERKKKKKKKKTKPALFRATTYFSMEIF
jgi:hypothetical protein